MDCTEGNIYRSSCSFSCEIGWELRGDDTLECDASGRWDGDIPFCQEIVCGARTAPLHGRISCSNRDKYNSKCSYSCDSGYELIGSDETDCQADGHWSYPSPKCVKVSCGPLVAPENGRLECSGTDALFGTECEAICNEGNRLQ